MFGSTIQRRSKRGGIVYAVICKHGFLQVGHQSACGNETRELTLFGSDRARRLHVQKKKSLRLSCLNLSVSPTKFLQW